MARNTSRPFDSYHNLLHTNIVLCIFCINRHHEPLQPYILILVHIKIAAMNIIQSSKSHTVMRRVK